MTARAMATRVVSAARALSSNGGGAGGTSVRGLALSDLSAPPPLAPRGRGDRGAARGRGSTELLLPPPPPLRGPPGSWRHGVGGGRLGGEHGSEAGALARAEAKSNLGGGRGGRRVDWGAIGGPAKLRGKAGGGVVHGGGGLETVKRLGVAVRRSDGIGGGGGGLAGREREGSEGEAAGRERFGEGRDGGGTRGGRVGHGAEEARVAEHGRPVRRVQTRGDRARPDLLG